jgi:hypothetical protein
MSVVQKRIRRREKDEIEKNRLSEERFPGVDYPGGKE